ncbi:hypothetical protein TNCV_4526821 [Trichonephila clavipes]|nr:hypothetical protein TNCV_4526821 [Trichonephila clavipes]
MRNSIQNLVVPSAPKPNMHLRDLLYVALLYDMDAVNFLHHENPPTWAGIEPAILDVQGQRLTNYAPQPA